MPEWLHAATDVRDTYAKCRDSEAIVSSPLTKGDDVSWHSVDRFTDELLRRVAGDCCAKPR